MENKLNNIKIAILGATVLLGGCEVYTDAGKVNFVSGFNDKSQIKAALIRAEQER